MYDDRTRGIEAEISFVPGQLRCKQSFSIECTFHYMNHDLVCKVPLFFWGMCSLRFCFSPNDLLVEDTELIDTTFMLLIDSLLLIAAVICRINRKSYNVGKLRSARVHSKYPNTFDYAANSALQHEESTFTIKCSI